MNSLYTTYFIFGTVFGIVLGNLAFAVGYISLGGTPMKIKNTKLSHVKVICFCGNTLTMPDFNCSRGVRCDICGYGFTVDAYSPRS
jgi:hypothetical protein